MPVPTWNVGQVLASTDVNTWFVPLSAVATADQSTTSQTFINDNTLSVPVAASANYAVELFLRYSTASTNLMQGQFTGPSGATLSLTIANAASANDINLSTLFAAGVSTGGPDFAAVFIGSLATSSTAGTLQFRFQSNTASSVLRRARSRLTLQRIG